MEVAAKQPFVLYPWKGNGVYERKPLAWHSFTHSKNLTIYCSMCGEEIERGAMYWRGIDPRGKSCKVACDQKCVKDWSPGCNV
jgi:hypothetical protein